MSPPAHPKGEFRSAQHEDAALSSPPQRIGRFMLQRELGRGAQAVVWLARDTRLEREVAIKRVEASGDAVGPWLHEARAVSRPAHPHIVPVFEADLAQEAGGRP